jgi:5-methylcytosine-specific restriction endonuclease McrA
MDKTCAICPATFTPVNQQQRYCGQACWYQANLQRSRANRKTGQSAMRECVGCQMQVTVIRTRGNTPRLCDGCRAERRRKRARNEERRRDARKRGAQVETFKVEEIYARDAWRCQLCHRAVPKDKIVPHPKAATLDHVLPLAEGGEHTRANVQLAHFECNWRKGTRGTQQLMLIG